MKPRVPHISFLAATLLLFLTACATSNNQWNSRIGAYTYSDAVREMGPPSISITQNDGSITAEWLRLRGGTQVVRAFPYSRRPYDTTPSAYHLHRTPDSYLRLTFGPDQTLARIEHPSR